MVVIWAIPCYVLIEYLLVLHVFVVVCDRLLLLLLLCLSGMARTYHVGRLLYCGVEIVLACCEKDSMIAGVYVSLATF